MRRHLTVVLAVLAAGLALCSSASAAPVLGFTQAKHDPEVIHRGDEIVGYLVKLKNNGDTATIGTTTLAVSLPPGLEMAFGNGGGWSCNVKAEICTSPQAVAAGAEFPQLRVQAWIDPAQAPQTVTAEFLAFGGGASFEATIEETFVLAPARPFDFESFTAKSEDDLGGDYTVAGGHPFSASTSFQFPTYATTVSQELQPPVGDRYPVENFRDIYVEPPPGFLANPEAIPAICSVQQVKEGNCPAAAGVGGIGVKWAGFDLKSSSAMYRVVPEDGFAAAFAFRPLSLSALTVVLRAKLRSNGEYRAVAVAPLAPQSPVLIGVEFATFCSHGVNASVSGDFVSCKAPTDISANPIPFLTNPTRCSGAAPATLAQVDSYQNVGRQDAEGYPDLSDPNWKGAVATSPQNEGCEALTEAWVGAREPSFTFQPDTARAAAPAAYSAHLHIPQDGLTEPDGTATAHLKDTTVRLPDGLVLNPSAAAGLDACGSAEAGYRGNSFPEPNPIRFSTVAPGCPGASKIGTAVASTPLLDHPLNGSIYLAAQGDNPFGSDFAVYLVIDDPKTGVKATIPGEVFPNPFSGQITATFENNPQAPVEDLDVSFFGGPRASLSNPDVCATYTTRVEMTPWSAADPFAPLPSETAISEDPVQITPGPGGGACAASKAQRPFEIGFSAKSTAPVAGAHSPFALRITRGEGSQELSGVNVTTPPGFAATLKGVGRCPDAGIGRARARTASGQGVLEIADPSCPASSQIGTTTIGAGSGPNPFYVDTGKVYLAGPYKGAPLSLAFIVPAVAGPFDLGVQVVQTALNVNPKNAQITAVSDPIPQILRGVPLQIRDVRVDLDRPGFSLNPTNCDAMAISGHIAGASGALVNASSRFQVGDCDRLGFKPKLKVQLHGGTKRAEYQRLEATVTARPGDANIARAAVTLPHSAFLAQEHIRTVCTRVQFAADACPPGSVYGQATAISPLLDEPLSGPVYLRSSNNQLPDLVVALRGPDSIPIEVELAGRTDSKNGGIRNTFDVVPDAPVSKFTLKLFGGKKSLIVNSRDLCKGPEQRATVRFSAQNGMARNFRPVVGNDCGKKKGERGEKGGRKPR
jgi:hypothetical protein